MNEGPITQEIKDFVNRTKLGFVASVCPDGSPNLSPRGTMIAWDDRHLAFADICSPGTTGNLLNNPLVEINVIDVFLRKGYRFKGTADVYKAGSLFDSIIKFYHDRGSKHSVNNIVVIKVNQITPVWSPAYQNNSEDEITRFWVEYWNSVHPKESK